MHITLTTAIGTISMLLMGMLNVNINAFAPQSQHFKNVPNSANRGTSKPLSTPNRMLNIKSLSAAAADEENEEKKKEDEKGKPHCGCNNQNNKFKLYPKKNHGPQTQCKKCPNAKHSWGQCFLNLENPNNKLGD